MIVIRKITFLEKTFEDLEPGDVFRDRTGDISVKTDRNEAVVLANGHVWEPKPNLILELREGAFVEGYGA